MWKNYRLHRIKLLIWSIWIILFTSFIVLQSKKQYSHTSVNFIIDLSQSMNSHDIISWSQLNNNISRLETAKLLITNTIINYNWLYSRSLTNFNDNNTIQVKIPPTNNSWFLLDTILSLHSNIPVRWSWHQNWFKNNNSDNTIYIVLTDGENNKKVEFLKSYINQTFSSNNSSEKALYIINIWTEKWATIRQANWDLLKNNHNDIYSKVTKDNSKKLKKISQENNWSFDQIEKIKKDQYIKLENNNHSKTTSISIITLLFASIFTIFLL